MAEERVEGMMIVPTDDKSPQMLAETILREMGWLGTS
jgi:hypothetical protein